MYNETPEMLQEQAYNVMETVEDIVEHICDENRMSGEKGWVMISALCEAKLAHLLHLLSIVRGNCYTFVRGDCTEVYEN